jgi:mono/diheme cytochrome c family protein
MKKMIVILILAGCMCACTHKIIVTNDQQAADPHDKKATPASILAGRYVYQSKCGSCHGLKNVGDYTASQWNGILQTMIPRAKLDDLETQQLVAFIKTQVSD